MGEGNANLVEPDGVEDLESLSHINEVGGIMEVKESAPEFGRLERDMYSRCSNI
jgi:hypothetical protein